MGTNLSDGLITFSRKTENKDVLFKLFQFGVFWSPRVACGSPVPQPGIKPTPPAMEAQSLSNWTTREVPKLFQILNIVNLLNTYLFIYLIYLFMAALGLHCCARAFSSCSEQGLFFVAVRVLPIAVASLVVEHGL